MMTKFQRGQSMVEFAIVLPFLFLICGVIIVLSLMFADYVQIQTEARSIARSCSVFTNQANAKNQIVAKYRELNDNKTTLTLFLYHCDINTDDMSVNYYHDENSDDNGYWTVTLEANPQNTNTGLWKLAYDIDKSAVPTIKAHCTMYSENDLTKNNQNNNNTGR